MPGMFCIVWPCGMSIPGIDGIAPWGRVAAFFDGAFPAGGFAFPAGGFALAELFVTGPFLLAGTSFFFWVALFISGMCIAGMFMVI
jgi:hypothetical protein